MFNNVYPREKYLKKIRPFYDSDIIKVITGIRRCGKSFILKAADNLSSHLSLFTNNSNEPSRTVTQYILVLSAITLWA